MSEFFWITNLTKMDIHLSDLAIRVPARGSINLLDNKHYSLTKEQIFKSLTEGSLRKRQGKIVVRQVPPQTSIQKSTEFDPNIVISSRRRSAINAEEVYYEELDISDDKFAEEAADFVDYNIKK